jgi:hypothetical protein
VQLEEMVSGQLQLAEAWESCQFSVTVYSSYIGLQEGLGKRKREKKNFFRN